MKRTDGQPADNMGDDVLKEETFIVHRSLALKPTDYKTKPRRKDNGGVKWSHVVGFDKRVDISFIQ